MRRKSFAQFVLGFVFLLTLADTREVTAANMRSFIESVRRKAPVVYVGSVREVRLLSRTHFDIKERAVVDVLAVMRGRGTKLPKPRSDIRVMTIKRQCWRAVRSISCGMASWLRCLQTHSQQPFLPDTCCTAP